MKDQKATLLTLLLTIYEQMSQCISILREPDFEEITEEAASLPPITSSVSEDAAPPSDSSSSPAQPKRKPADTPPTSLPSAFSTAVPLAALRKALAEKSLAGYAEEVRALIKKHGASSLNSVDPSHYADMLREAAEIGGTNHD